MGYGAGSAANNSFQCGYLQILDNKGVMAIFEACELMEAYRGISLLDFYS
jgi:hypothetical protein